jgi:hypothetical protein
MMFQSKSEKFDTKCRVDRNNHIYTDILSEHHCPEQHECYESEELDLKLRRFDAEQKLRRQSISK